MSNVDELLLCNAVIHPIQITAKNPHMLWNGDYVDQNNHYRQSHLGVLRSYPSLMGLIFELLKETHLIS